MAINNPTELAFELARRDGARKFVIVSLGTGETPAENLQQLERSGAAAWASPLFSLMMSAASKFVDQRLVLERKAAAATGLEIEYVRIQPIIHHDASIMDKTAPENINILEGYADLILDERDHINAEKFNIFISQLEKRLADKGIYPKNGLNHKIDFQISQIKKSGELLLEGPDIDNDIFTKVKRKIFEIYTKDQIILSVKLLDTFIDNWTVPDVVDILKHFQVKNLVLDGSRNIGQGGLLQLSKLLKADLPLENLSLKDVGITDKIVHIFGILANENQRIIRIKLGKNDISKRVIKELSSVKSISFDDNPIEDPLTDEEIYQRFLNGRLIYKPNTDNDSDKIEMRIADLTNPLEGTFDLSQCGDMQNHLSISTGYRKGKKPENANKLEIWFVPRFLVKKEINGQAEHLKFIFPDHWPNTVEIGIIWSWGGWDDAGHYDYLTTQNVNLLSTGNLYEKWSQSLFCKLPARISQETAHITRPYVHNIFSKFIFDLS